MPLSPWVHASRRVDACRGQMAFVNGKRRARTISRSSSDVAGNVEAVLMPGTGGVVSAGRVFYSHTALDATAFSPQILYALVQTDPFTSFMLKNELSSALTFGKGTEMLTCKKCRESIFEGTAQQAIVEIEEMLAASRSQIEAHRKAMKLGPLCDKCLQHWRNSSPWRTPPPPQGSE